jgi:hypothetical protein
VIGLIVGAEGFLALFVFFLAYFVAYEPYRALYPDLDLGVRFGSVERLSGREIVPFANGLEKESRGPRMPAGAPIVTRLCRQLAGEVLWLHRSLPSF